jgi:hypothetical protein
MLRSLSTIFALVSCFLAVAFAIYQPIAPLQGSYTWEIVVSNSSGPVAYAGGRTWYDFVAGYVRMDSYDEQDPTPGINGVSLWDLRETQPIVITIDTQADCWVERLNDNVTAPVPPDWSAYTLSQVTYFNRALAEEWTDGFGGVVYVDVFSRDVVGMGNYSTADGGESIFYNIEEWDDDKPDGTLFLLPNTVPCQNIGALESYGKAVKKVEPMSPMFSFKCTGCKIAIGVILGRLCTVAGAAACAPFPPAIPFCATLATLACKVGAGKLSKDAACKAIHLC